MAQLLRAPAALPESLDSFPTNTCQLTTVSPGVSKALFWLSQARRCIWGSNTHWQNTHTHEIKINNFFLKKENLIAIL